MGKLIDLRHLSFIGFFVSKKKKSWWIFLLEMSNISKGFEKLISLWTLSDFNIGGKNEREWCKLGELKKLNHVWGSLRIYELGNMIDVSNAEDA